MARRMCNPKQPSRHITRPWLLLIATYPGHFDLVLNLCRSMAAHATDSGSVSVRLGWSAPVASDPVASVGALVFSVAFTPCPLSNGT